MLKEKREGGSKCHPSGIVRGWPRFMNFFWSNRHCHTVLVISGSLAKQVRTPGYIITVAGTEQYGHGGDDGPATEASFNSVSSVVETKKGDIFIADEGACVIRKITRSTGKITTIGGTPGECEDQGDGGPATSAKLRNPSGLYFDESSGSLYIADYVNHRIRMIDSEGKISTVAGGGRGGDGGLATEARLSFPIAVIGNSKGELFILDSYNVSERLELTTRFQLLLAMETAESMSKGKKQPNHQCIYLWVSQSIMKE